MAHAPQGLKLLDIEAVVLLYPLPQVVHHVLYDETGQDRTFSPDLLHERPERGIGGVQHAGHDVFSGLGFAQVEDNSK